GGSDGVRAREQPSRLVELAGEREYLTERLGRPRDTGIRRAVPPFVDRERGARVADRFVATAAPICDVRGGDEIAAEHRVAVAGELLRERDARVELALRVVELARVEQPDREGVVLVGAVERVVGKRALAEHVRAAR